MKFLNTGLQPTFQDSGRFGFQSSGMNPDGVMDGYTFRLLNILLQNSENEGVLEMNFPAPQLLFEENATICLGGADFGAMLDNQPLTLYKTVNVSVGSHLKFTKKISGERAYLAVKGGFQLNKWLGSVSTNLVVELPAPLIEKRLSVKLKKGNILAKSVWLGGNMQPPLCPPPVGEGSTLLPLRGEGWDGGLSIVLRFLPGPEFHLLTSDSKEKLLTQPFIITKNANRMGYRLLGEKLETIEKVNLLSSGVTFGTMQLLPDGQIIILMASHQTTGGYPRIGNIIAVDLPRLAQSGPGTVFTLTECSVLEAEHLYFERQQRLKRLEVGVRLTTNLSA